METNELFIISVRYYIDKKGIKIKHLANMTGIEYKQVSEFLNKKRNFSEERKEQIAKYLGTTYLDMLNLGRELSKSAESALLPGIEKRTKCTFGDQAADDHPSGTGKADQKARMRKKLFEMTSDLDEKELRKLQSVIEDEIEKKRLKEKLESLLEERKAG